MVCLMDVGRFCTKTFPITKGLFSRDSPALVSRRIIMKMGFLYLPMGHIMLASFKMPTSKARGNSSPKIIKWKFLVAFITGSHMVGPSKVLSRPIKFMMDSFKMASSQEEANTTSQISSCIRASSRMEICMVKEEWSIIMAVSLLEILIMGKKQQEKSGPLWAILEEILMRQLKGKAYTNGMMVNFILAHLKTTCFTERGQYTTSTDV